MNFPENSLAERALSARGYFGYLWLTIKGTTVYSVYGKIASVARKYAILSKVIRVAAAVASAVKASAALLFVFGVLSALLPAMLIHAVVFIIVGVASFRRADEKIGRITGSVYIFAEKNGRVSSATANCLAGRGKVICLTRSICKCGFSGAKEMRDGSVSVHIGYYFRMKKILVKNGAKIYFIG